MERKVPSKESFQLFNTIPQAFHTLQAIECSQGIKGVQGTLWALVAGTRVRLERGGGILWKNYYRYTLPKIQPLVGNRDSAQVPFILQYMLAVGVG